MTDNSDDKEEKMLAEITEKSETPLKVIKDSKGLVRVVDVVSGRFYSKYEVMIEAHPKSQEIIDLISKKKELKIGFLPLQKKILKEYGVSLDWQFLRWYHRRHYTNPLESLAFQYQLDEQERLLNIVEHFTSLQAVFKRSVNRDKMDFRKEVQKGKSYESSWKKSLNIFMMNERLMNLGSAIGYFPALQSSGPVIQINNNTQNANNIQNNSIMRLVDEFVPENPKPENTNQ